MTPKEESDLENEIQQFVHDNHYNLVLDCRRDLADIYYAIRDFHEMKLNQLKDK